MVKHNDDLRKDQLVVCKPDSCTRLNDWAGGQPTGRAVERAGKRWAAGRTAGRPAIQAVERAGKWRAAGRPGGPGGRPDGRAAKHSSADGQTAGEQPVE